MPTEVLKYCFTLNPWRRASSRLGNRHCTAGTPDPFGPVWLHGHAREILEQLDLDRIYTGYGMPNDVRVHLNLWNASVRTSRRVRSTASAIFGSQFTLFAMWFDMESNKDLR